MHFDLNVIAQIVSGLAGLVGLIMHFTSNPTATKVEAVADQVKNISDTVASHTSSTAEKAHPAGVKLAD